MAFFLWLSTPAVCYDARVKKKFDPIMTIVLVVFAVICAIIVKTTTDNTATMSTDGSDAERSAIKAEGQAILSDMDKANRDHDWSRVDQIRARENAFYDRASRFQAAHPTPH